MQEMTMVEMVARAIARKNTGSGINWPDFTDEARAAIKAMREPTEKMVSCSSTDESIYDAWQSMIDAALSE